MSPSIDRFQSKVDWHGGPTTPGFTPCSLWTGARTRKGYGAFYSSDDRRARQSHVWAYEHFVGPIPEGFEVDHLCHNADESCKGGPTCPHRACVEPTHLEAVSPHVNTLRGRRNHNTTKTHCKNGHAYDLVFIDSRTGHPSRACSECRKEAKRRKRALLKAL
jgi:hypothetical protein